MPAVRAVQGTVCGLWKTARIFLGRMTPECIAANPECTGYIDNPSLYLDTSDGSKQSKAMSHTSLSHKASRLGLVTVYITKTNLHNLFLGPPWKFAGLSIKVAHT